MELLAFQGFDFQSDWGQLAIKLLWTFAIGLGIFLLVKVIRRAWLRGDVSIEARHKIRGFTTWIGAILFLLAVAMLWLSDVQNLGLFLGLLGAGLALSMQETLACIVGWLLLVIRRPYEIGDRIEIDGRKGDVIGVSVFQTSLLEVGNWVQADQSTGRMLILPNSLLLRNAVYNYTKGFPFIWNEFSAVITFESDAQAAEEIMLGCARREDEKIDSEVKSRIKEMQAHYAIRYKQLDPIVYVSIADNGVKLTLRFLSPVRKRREMNDRLAREILQAFNQHDPIALAYPTTRFVDKPGGSAQT